MRQLKKKVLFWKFAVKDMYLIIFIVRNHKLNIRNSHQFFTTDDSIFQKHHGLQGTTFPKSEKRFVKY